MKKSVSITINIILTSVAIALLVLLNLQIFTLKDLFNEPVQAAGLAAVGSDAQKTPGAADTADVSAIPFGSLYQSDEAKSALKTIKQQLSDRTKLDDFLAPNLWSGVSAASRQGSVTITGSGEFVEASRKYDGLLPLGTYLYIDIEANGLEYIDWMTLYLMENQSYENYFEFDLLAAMQGANELIANKKDILTGSGTPEWDNISTLRIAFGTRNDAKVSVTLNEISTYEASPMCSIWFDDGWKTMYTGAFPVMKDKGFKGILSVVSSYVGSPAFCSEAELSELYDSGWDLVNHTDEHQDLTKITGDEAEAGIAKCFNYLESRGFTRASRNVVPPYCAADEKTDELISRLAATSRVLYSTYNLLPVTDPYHLGFREVFSDTGVETVKQWIDEAIQNDLWLVLLFHSIESAADKPTKCSPENFKEIMDCLDKKRGEISVVTLSEVLDADIIEKSGAPAPKSDAKGRELIFEEEFNTALDGDSWNIVEAEPFKNSELQTYTQDAVSVRDGMLTITSDKQKGGYTSGAVTTENKQLFQYGTIEIRAKLPSGQGIFPAFWLLPQSGSQYPEIDIMELLGHEPDSAWHVMHYEKNGKKRKYSSEYKGEPFDEGFHVFALQWTEHSVKWFIDGEETYSVSENIPSEKMFLYLNTAVGGDWPGNPDGTTRFPQTMQIDYIRYYR